MTEEEVLAKAEEVADQIRKATPEQLIAGMYSLVRPVGRIPLDDKSAREMVRTLALRLAAKVVEPGFCDD